MPKSKFWLEALLDIVFPPPPFCLLCGAFSAGGQICDHCLQKMEDFRRRPFCFRCGRIEVDEAWQDQTDQTGNRKNKFICPECLNSERYFTLARSAGLYEGALKEAIFRFKYGRKRSLARPLGRLLAGVVKELLSWPESPGAAGLVPVPLTRRRLEERGFNQAELLAQEASALTGLPLFPLLQKLRETPPQTGLSRKKRKNNLAGAFDVLAGGLAKIPSKSPVILVDDVFTTGSTSEECARVLLAAGIKEVYVATLAAAVWR